MHQRSRAKRTNLRVSAAEAEPVGSSVAGSQETYGNGVSSAALRGDDLGGLGPVVRHTIARSVAGVSDALPPLRDQGSGTPLPDAVRGRMEAAFGHDFGHVRIHVGSVAAGDAEALQAHAFAVGADIYFGSGEWAPGSAEGDRLLAHELTHVVQHDEGRLGGGSGVSSPGDPSEREAYGNEARILRALPAASDPAPAAPAAPSPRRPSRRASRRVMRAASAVPAPELQLDLDPESMLGGFTDIAEQATAGPLTTHKVETGGRMSELDAQPQQLVTAMSASPVGFDGLGTPAEAVVSEAPTELEGHDGPPPEVPAPVTEPVDVEPAAAAVEDGQSELDAAMSCPVELPQGGGNTPEPTGDGGTSEERPSNRDEVERELDGVDTTFDVPLDRPATAPLVLDGDADPAHVAEADAEISNCMNDHALDAFGLMIADRGEGDVAPTRAVEVVPPDPSTLQCEAPDTSADAVFQQALAESNLGAEQHAFTEDVDVVGHVLAEGQGEIDAVCADTSSELTSDLATLETDARADLDTQLAEATRREADAHAALEAQVCDARSEWSAEREAALAQSQADASSQVDDANRQIDAERAHFDAEVESAVDGAMSDAQAEQQRAEQAAARERARAEAEAEDGGFWDWVGSVLDTVIEALTSFVAAVFEALNAAINLIFQALEWVIAGLVDVIQELVVGIINLLRVALELLCHALEAVFGEQATRWISAIDGFLADTISVLDAVFDWLGEALVGVLEFVNQGLQAVVTLIQWSVTALVMVMTGLWIRYLWLAIENFDRLWTNIQGSFSGLWGELVERSGPAWEEFWTNFWTPGNQLLLGIGAIVFIVGLFVGVSEVVAIIMMILAVLYLATVAVHVGEQFFAYCEQIWNDDVAGARRTLADTLLFLLFNAPLILLSVFGIKGGLEALSGRGGGGAGEGGRGGGEGGEGRGSGEGGEGRGTGEGEGEGRGPSPRDGCFVAGTLVHGESGPVPIESIRVGDRVLGMQMDGVAPRPAVGVVQHLFTRVAEQVVAITAGDETLVCSLEHPFYVPDRGWVPAGELTAGMALVSREGRPIEVRAVVRHDRPTPVHNIEVAGIHDYFVGGEGILVHNKAMRWMLQDRAAALEGRAAEIIERASALPDDAPGRAEVLEGARELQAEAARLSEAGRSAADEAAIEGERGAIEATEDALAELEGRLELAELPPELAQLDQDAAALETRAGELPNEVPTKWDLISRVQRLRGDIEAVRELMREGSGDPSLVDEYWSLRRQLAELEREIGEAEPTTPGADPWNERLDRARWTDHGRKHLKARTAEEAREMSMPDDNGKARPSQYLPDVDNAALELEALRNGEVIRGDPTVPDGTVHVQYETGRVIGYDGGEAVTTMRAEITAGDVYHGHPRAF